MFNTKEIVHVRLRRQEDKVSHGNRVLTFSATIVEHGYLISITSSRLRVPALVLARFVVGERVMPYGVESRSQQDHHTLARHCCSSVSLDRRPRGCGAPFVFCCWGSPHPWLWRPLDPICYIAPPLPPPYMYPSLRFPPLEIHATCISALDRHHLLGLLWSGVRGTTPERLGGCVFGFYRVVDAEEDLWLAKGGGC